jgi:hypothetical protein
MSDGDDADGDAVIAKENNRAFTCMPRPSDVVRAYMEAGILRQGAPIGLTSNTSALGAGTYRQPTFS